MTVELKPETQALIQQDLKRGPYLDAADFVEQAVAMLHQQEVWLAENRARIAANIEEGYASAQRGELIDEDDVQTRMDKRKRDWLEMRRGVE